VAFARRKPSDAHGPATVNKDGAGGQKPGGSGRGEHTGHPRAHKGARLAAKPPHQGLPRSAPPRRRLLPPARGADNRAKMPARLGIPEIAPLLVELGRRTALAGGNPFRAKAYLRSAEGWPLGRSRSRADRGRAAAGDSGHRRYHRRIVRLAQTGAHPSLEKMRAEIPRRFGTGSVPELHPDKVMKHQAAATPR
jgi:hypothetical protein